MFASPARPFPTQPAAILYALILPTPPSPTTPWREILTPRVFLAVIALTLVLAFERWFPLAWVDSADRLDLIAFRLVRGNLISGGLLIIAIVMLFALFRDPPNRLKPRAGLVAVIFCLGTATAGSALRIVVAGSLGPGFSPGWLLANSCLWASLSLVAYFTLTLLGQERRAAQTEFDSLLSNEGLQAQVTQAHLSALQAQIEPHFLFNTLANVRRLYEVAPDRGEQMLTSLIEYLRAALPSMRQSESSLDRELELARAYLTVLQLRMGDRLRFTITCEDDLRNAEVPPLIVGTLLENAIKHGLSPLPEGGQISIAAYRSSIVRKDDSASIEVREAKATEVDPGALTIDVIDSGMGFSGQSGSGVGLANIRSRLAAIYQGQARLLLLSNEPRGVIARVELPYRPFSSAAGATHLGEAERA